MATGTAPVWTAAAGIRQVTLHLIDASGDLWTDEMFVPVGTTAALLAAWQAAYQAATQASIYKTTDASIRSGAMSAGNADAGARSGGESGINITYKNWATLDTLPSRLIAPVPEVMVGDTDTVDTATAEFIALRDAVVAIKTGFAFAEAQYTVHRERRNNTRVRG